MSKTFVCRFPKLAKYVVTWFSFGTLHLWRNDFSTTFLLSERVYLPQNINKTYKIIVSINSAGYQIGKHIKLVVYNNYYITSYSQI